MEEKYENFMAAVRKMRNAGGQQGAVIKVEMRGSEKKANRNTSNKIFREYIRQFLHKE